MASGVAPSVVGGVASGASPAGTAWVAVGVGLTRGVLPLTRAGPLGFFGVGAGLGTTTSAVIGTFLRGSRGMRARMPSEMVWSVSAIRINARTTMFGLVAAIRASARAARNAWCFALFARAAAASWAWRALMTAKRGRSGGRGAGGRLTCGVWVTRSAA